MQEQQQMIRGPSQSNSNIKRPSAKVMSGASSQPNIVKVNMNSKNIRPSQFQPSGGGINFY